MYDLRNKYITLNSQLPAGESVQKVFRDVGASTAYVLTSSGSLIRYTEKTTANKLDVLMKRALYPQAIILAAEEQCDPSEIMKLYKMYADHLYEEGDFWSAVEQYCNTIGYVQSSYVVRKFLEPRRMPQLIMYLRRLVDKGVATKDHVTMLFTTLIKVAEREPGKLNEFLEQVIAAVEKSTISGSASSNNDSKLSSSTTVETSFPASDSLSVAAAASGKNDKSKVPLEHVLVSAVDVDLVISMLIKAQLTGSCQFVCLFACLLRCNVG